MPADDIACVLDARSLNGETPLWDARRQRLFWVDIREPALHAFDPTTGEDRSWQMPAWIGCYGLTATGAVVALRTGLHELEFDSGALRFAAPAPFDARRFIFNDGRCDPAGRFLAGPMYVPLPPVDRQHRAAPLCRYEGGAHWRPIGDPVSTSNGLAWSPDGRTMYHADTEQRTIWAWNYDVVTGEVADRRVFACVNVNDGGPDGAAVDRDGFYWCAVFANACLLRFDPAGKLERKVAMPVRYPTMPAFGGAALDTLYVTTASWPIPERERPSHPGAGSLFAMPAPVPGLPEPYWQAPESV